MTFFDKILIIALLTFGILSLTVINFFALSSPVNTVVVEVDGKLYGRYSFSEINTTKTIEIITDFGYNLLEIESNRVRVKDASCKDKLDVLEGWISKPNQILVCLPNKMLVRIIGEAHIDGVTY